MAAAVNEYLAYWETIRDSLKRGGSVVRSLEQAEGKLSDPDLRAAAKAVRLDVLADLTYAAALGKHPAFFTRTMVVLAGIGEAAGILDEELSHLIEGLRDGAFGVPGAAREAQPPHLVLARFFQAFGLLLTCGVPVLEALELVGAETCDTGLSRAIPEITRAIGKEDKDFSAALRDFPDIFAPRVCGAVEAGEQRGLLDELVLEIGKALRAGDLSTLPTPAPPPRGVITIDEDAGASPVVKQVNEIIAKASEHASDIHLEPAADGSLRARLRVDGVLQDLGTLPGQANMYISRVKILAGLNVAERKLPQEGRILVKVRGKELTLFLSVVPTYNGEYAVLRLAPMGPFSLKLPQIFSNEAELQTVRRLVQQPHGVIFCSGPAGSGKSSLAFAMLQEPEIAKYNVLSIEDPVYMPMPGVKQVEVAPQRGLTFPRAIEAVMHLDPDVLLIGEVRDLETAQAAIEAAISGHLVIAVMHANTPLVVVRTLREMGVAPFRMSAAVIGIISQRLVQKLCPNCRRKAEMPLKGAPPEVAEFLRQHPQAEVYEPTGCATCGAGKGYRGRIAIHSILIPDEDFHSAVAASAAGCAALKAAARAAGMKSLFTSAMEKVIAGLTSVEKAWQTTWDDR